MDKDTRIEIQVKGCHVPFSLDRSIHQPCGVYAIKSPRTGEHIFLRRADVKSEDVDTNLTHKLLYCKNVDCFVCASGQYYTKTVTLKQLHELYHIRIKQKPVA